MLTISNKGKLMPESPIRKLVPFAEKAKQKGVKVFHLNIGQPDIETPTAAIEAVRNSKIKVLAYSKSEGDIELRNKICNYYSNLNIQLNSLFWIFCFLWKYYLENTRSVQTLTLS